MFRQLSSLSVLLFLFSICVNAQETDQKIVVRDANANGVLDGDEAALAETRETARGVVYLDANGNGSRDGSEEGMSGVAVSNGVDVVQTDAEGEYELSVGDDNIVFVIKPPQYRTAVDEQNLPRFYYIHKPGGSPASKFPGVEPTGDLPGSVDFPLYKQDESNEFRVIFFGDPQPRNAEEVNYIAHDIVEELVGYDASFGVTLGDIVFDDLDVFELINGVVGRIGAPWYNVIGNHDINRAENDALSDETFERVYGPAYYAFNYGPVHFIVLDDVAWDGDGYHGEIGEKQLAFIENNLKCVSKDKLVVLMMHIPLVSVDDRFALLNILEPFEHTFSVSAHWHRQGHFFMSEHEEEALGDHHHFVHGTVSGSWWSGLADEFGIPHAMMSDGTPNGYSIATFNGPEYSFRYKASRRPADFQMSIFAPDLVSAGGASDHEVIVNVFLGSERSKVEMRFGEEGPWVPLSMREAEDPYYQQLKKREYYLPRAAGRPLPDARASTHLWAGPLPENPPRGTHVIYVRTKDMFGQVFEGKRIIRVD